MSSLSPVISIGREKPRLSEKFAGRLYPFDHLVLVYCWATIVLTVILGRPIEPYWPVILFHAAAIALVILMALIGPGHDYRAIAFFRLLYPVILMTFFYLAAGKLVHLVFPEFFDHRVTAMESGFLGIDPTLWLDQHLHVVITEFFSAAYCSYYFLVPGLALVLFFGRRDAEIVQFMTAVCAAFFVSYMIFIFYPLEGPRYFFAAQYQNPISGPFFYPLVVFVIDNIAFHGGAMPSSHCAVALVVALTAIRNYGKRAWFLLFIVGALSAATVYGRYHYLSDVVVGLGLGAASYLLTSYFFAHQTEEQELPIITRVVNRQYVSGYY